VTSTEHKRWTPTWGALSVAALALGAAGFARCGAAQPSQPAAPPPASSAIPAPAPEPVTAEAKSAPSAEPEPPPPPPPPEEKQAYVVAVIGDSLTDARSGGGKFIDYVKKRCPESRFDNYGRGGDMANQMRKRFFRDLLPVAHAARYTHLVVFGGVNDLYSDLTAGRTPEKVGKDFSSMFTAARERKMKIVALTVAPWGGFSKYYNERRGKTTLELNAWIKRQAEEGTIDHVVDTYALLSCGDPERLCPELAAPYRDGIHFGPGGHEKIGAALYETAFTSCR
jgi:lysophospholipase L1-like esterase